MRSLLLLPAIGALAACNVSTNGANNSVTVQYNGTAAQDAANTASNIAQNVGNDISSDVQNTVAKVQNTNVTVSNNSDNEAAEQNKATH